MKKIINPFCEYFPIKQNNLEYVVSKVFRPEISFKEKDHSLIAWVKERAYTIFGLDDIINYHGKKIKGSGSYFQGSIIGERMLYLIIKELIIDTKKKIRKNPNLRFECGIIKEEDKDIGKELVVTYNDKYILKHKGKINFTILEKSSEMDPSHSYHQEKHGLQATEIDGMGYFHCGYIKKGGGIDYSDKNTLEILLIGESKTSTNSTHFKKWDHKMNGSKNIVNRIFDPLVSLYANHEFIYVFLAHDNILWDNNSYKVREFPSRIIRQLEDTNIGTILIPFPSMPKELNYYAWKMANVLKLIRKTKKFHNK